MISALNREEFWIKYGMCTAESRGAGVHIFSFSVQELSCSARYSVSCLGWIGTTVYITGGEEVL